MTMVGQPAPEWSATAYVKGEQKTISNTDYKGKWHVLYWYPLDFTFVCPTEIKGFQSLLDDFGDDKVEVIGVSTDSFFSHKAWFADRKTFPQEITHPVIARHQPRRVEALPRAQGRPGHRVPRDGRRRRQGHRPPPSR